MGQYINLLRNLPFSQRPLDERKIISESDKAAHWALDKGYFDGTRDQGYGGYKNDGRWLPVSDDIANHYKLDSKSSLLEIGCAKGFLLEALRDKIGIKNIWGLDISSYALSNSRADLHPQMIIGNCKDLPFDDKVFDLVVSINSLHNLLNINDVIESLREIQRVSKGKSYITVGAFNSSAEKLNLDQWAVVATTYLHENDWLELFDIAGYTGDYFWFKPNQSFGQNDAQ